MSRDFVLIVDRSGCGPGRLAAAESAALRLRPDFQLVRLTSTASLMIGPGLKMLTASGGIVVLGEIYSRCDAPTPISHVIKPINGDGTSRASFILKNYWGSYIAIFVDEGAGTIAILRDPSGTQPCFTADRDGLRAVSSSTDHLCDLEIVDGSIDWSTLSELLAYREMSPRRTALQNVAELLPGDLLTNVNGEWRFSVLWSPVSFASPNLQFKQRPEAVQEFRQEMLRTVKALVTGRPNAAVLRLSGGLDSSIIAATLAEAKVDFTCATATTDAPGVDESHYAQRVANHLCAPLVRVNLRADAIDIDSLAERRGHQPLPHLLSQIAGTAFTAAAASAGAERVFDGNGGDFILGGFGTSAPAADALSACGPGIQFLRTLSDLSVLWDCTIWRAGRFAVKKAWKRSPPSAPVGSEFVSGKTLNHVPDIHPWVDAAQNLWPGKTEQIKSLSLCSAYDVAAQQTGAVACHPLLSQPIIELCLRIPSWMSVVGGRNRAVARDAFADLLPREIVDRRTKGTFRAFNKAVYVRNLPRLKELLMDGDLYRRGLLDRRAIETYLNTSVPSDSIGFSSILKLACAEVWVRSQERHVTVPALLLSA